MLKNPKDLVKGVGNLLEELKKLQKQYETLNHKMAGSVLADLKNRQKHHHGIDLLIASPDVDQAVAKNLVFSLTRENKNLVVLLGTENAGKAFLTLGIGETAIKNKKLDASKIIGELAKEISGGGGGQAHFATAGGKEPGGLKAAFGKLENLIK
jgi:alanyl-tRNA synthetase